MVLYFAKFHKNSDNQYEVSFPDLESYDATYGDTLEEAIQSAHDSLTGYLLTEEDFHEEVPTPTDDPEKFKLKEPNFLVPVQVDLQLEREKEENKLVKKI
ncbi:antitoxin HicB [Lactobacillus gallinarum]|nr:antitoxin HicB [Lactobacillus gallinarum]